MDMDAHRYEAMVNAGGLFSGMDAQRLPEVLSALRARQAQFAVNETVLAIGQPVDMMGYVLSGAISISFINAEGIEVILRIARAGESFLSEMAYLQEKKNSLLLRAEEPSEVLFLDISPVRRGEDLPCGRQLVVNLTEGFVRTSQKLYEKARLYSQKRIRSRVVLYLMSQPRQDNVVTLPMNRTELAAYLGVDRTALARELSRMQSDGIIALDRQRVTLLDKELFR